jgi:hypothetical protein
MSIYKFPLVVFLVCFASVPGYALVRHHHSLTNRAAWTGTGIAAGEAVPGGGAVIGTIRHRHEFAAGGHARNKALIEVGAPAVAGVTLGPAGVVGYEGIAHRRWIESHIFGMHGHH